MARHTSSSGHLALAAGTGLLILGIALHPATTQAAGGKVFNRTFTVVAVNSAVTPPTLVVERTWDGPEITVDLSPTTTIVRRFNGKSDLSELSAGDHVLISGTNAATQTLSAATIKDNSIQVGYSQINATVTFVSRDFSQMAVHITANEGTNAAFGVGSTVMTDITPSTVVTFLGGQAGTVQGLRPGMVVTLYGFSDRAGQLIVSPHDITQLLATQAAALTHAAPNDSTPK